MATELRNAMVSVTAGGPAPKTPLLSLASNSIDLPKLHVCGLSARYGINTIPTMTLDLTPDDLGFICDFEKYRRAPVEVKVQSTSGCLFFQGLLDGVSVSQSIGDIRLQVVIKNPFQLLQEINAKLPGYHAAGVDFTKRLPLLQVDHAKDGQSIAALRLGLVGVDPKKYPIDVTAPIGKGIVQVFKALIASQAGWAQIQSIPGPLATNAITAAKEIGETHAAMAAVLLDNIDLSFVDSELTLGDFNTFNQVFETICATRTNVFDALVAVFDQALRCSLVVANDKAFVVPSSGFLSQMHSASPKVGVISEEVNVVNPAQYNAVTVNDSGYRDIRGVYVLADDRNQTLVDGLFVDNSVAGGVSGGIIGVTAPYTLVFNNALLRAAALTDLKKSIAAGDANTAPAKVTTPTTEEATAAAVQTEAAKEEAAQQEEFVARNALAAKSTKALKEFLNDWAQLEYYQMKYADRIGSISTIFNPNFAPGAVGTLYMRHPGVYTDFFVTSVSHDIRVSAPDHGTATTSVGFNCARTGMAESTQLSAGLEKFSLFKDFTAATSKEVAAAFVRNIKNATV